jgi:hypothetical protein
MCTSKWRFIILLSTCNLHVACAQRLSNWTDGYSLEINSSSNGYTFNAVPYTPINPLFNPFFGNEQQYGSGGFGAAFSKALTNISRIKIAPSFFSTHDQLQYSESISVLNNSSTIQQTFNMSGFSIPVTYISYFKKPKHKISCYFIATEQYYSFKLTTFNAAYQDSVETSSEENHYSIKGLGLEAGIGLDYKIIKQLYLFYEFTGGVTLTDGTFFGDFHFGAGYNFFAKKHSPISKSAH